MFAKISDKQALSYFWWRLEQFKAYKMFVAHGAIRTGKTVFSSWAFFDWSEYIVKNTPNEKKPQGWNKFNVIGATRFTVRDNVVDPMLDYATQKRGYIRVSTRKDLRKYFRSVYIDGMEGVVTFKNDKSFWTFKYMGVNNKRSVISLQGGTRRGTFIDEAALISIPLIEQAIGRNITFEDHKVFMTCNPEGDDTHDFYQQYIKGGKHKSILVLQYELLDNPLFNLADVERMRKLFTPVMFERRVLGLWVRDSGVIYKKFSERRHVHAFYDEVDDLTYADLRVGVDYGEVDATVFTLTGMLKGWSGLDVISAYYHKNSDTSEKDINDYTDDFFEWITKHYSKFRKRITVYVESASNGVTFYKLLKKRAVELGIRWLMFKLVNKAKRLQTSSSAIKERIDTYNIMLGADFIRIEQACRNLIMASKKSVWHDDKEERLDDKSVDIDSLDSFEYSWVSLIPKIIERIEFLRR